MTPNSSPVFYFWGRMVQEYLLVVAHFSSCLIPSSDGKHNWSVVMHRAPFDEGTSCINSCIIHWRHFSVVSIGVQVKYDGTIVVWRTSIKNDDLLGGQCNHTMWSAEGEGGPAVIVPSAPIYSVVDSLMSFSSLPPVTKRLVFNGELALRYLPLFMDVKNVHSSVDLLYL